MTLHSNFQTLGSFLVPSASGTVKVEYDSSGNNELQFCVSVYYAASSASGTGLTLNVTNGVGPPSVGGTTNVYINTSNPYAPFYDSVGTNQPLNLVMGNDSSPQTVNTVFNVPLAIEGNWIKLTFTNIDPINPANVTLYCDAL